MSDTPETDKQSFVAEHNEGKELCVEAWFCEKLERERDAAVAELNKLKSANNKWVEPDVAHPLMHCSKCGELRLRNHPCDQPTKNK